MSKHVAMVINLILDESGSMGYQRATVIKAVNKYLKEQKEKSREDVLFSLTKFTTSATIVHNAVPIEDVPDLSLESYNPLGGTALYDAIGETIIAIENQIEPLHDKKMTPSILCVVFTDGQENSSTEYGGVEGLAKIKKMIQEREKGEDWTFVFLGSSPDAWKQAVSMGFSQANTMKYSNSNYAGTMETVSCKTAQYGDAVRGGSVKELRAKGFFSDSIAQQIDMGDGSEAEAEAEADKGDD